MYLLNYKIRNQEHLANLMLRRHQGKQERSHRSSRSVINDLFFIYFNTNKN